MSSSIMCIPRAVRLFAGVKLAKSKEETQTLRSSSEALVLAFVGTSSSLECAWLSLDRVCVLRSERCGSEEVFKTFAALRGNTSLLEYIHLRFLGASDSCVSGA